MHSGSLSQSYEQQLYNFFRVLLVWYISISSSSGIGNLGNWKKLIKYVQNSFNSEMCVPFFASLQRPLSFFLGIRVLNILPLFKDETLKDE